MHIDNLSLVLMLAIEYNQLVNSSAILTTPPDVDDNSNSDMSNLCITIIDETDIELEEVETEMIVLLNSEPRKRKLSECTPGNQQKGKRRGKYNMSKLWFTDPFTIEWKKFTYDFSIWYINYVVNPQHLDKKWSKKFRNRFRMPYSSYLDLVHQCNISDYFLQ